MDKEDNQDTGGLKVTEWLESEIADTLDEDIEIELEDALLSRAISKIYQSAHAETLPRQEYLIVVRNHMEIVAHLVLRRISEKVIERRRHGF